MDLNYKSMDFTVPSQQVHNFMHVVPSSFMLPQHYHHQTTEEDAEEDCRLMQLRRKNLELFWNQQLFEIYNTSALKSHQQLPLARIKKIMKSDGEVKMISADTPIVFSKACELFIMELTLRAWLQTEECKRRTLQRCDIGRAIRLDDLLDFLVDVVPLDHHHYYQAEETGKRSKEIHDFRVAESLPLPMMINNIGELVKKSPEISQPFMIEPMSCVEDE